jgi:hypothetical protein
MESMTATLINENPLEKESTHGPSIYLGTDALKRLSLDQTKHKVGDKFDITAKAKVTLLSNNTMEIEITDMDLTPLKTSDLTFMGS